jgi:hypothetical protein
MSGTLIKHNTTEKLRIWPGHDGVVIRRFHDRSATAGETRQPAH